MISIDGLPNDVLLAIFDSYLREEDLHSEEPTQAWQSLIHVCRRWRRVVFDSPRRLDLRLCCTDSTRSRDMLNIWPALPIIIMGDEYFSARSVDNIAAALEFSDRVREINLTISESFVWDIFLAAMLQPFPELTYLSLQWDYDIDEPAVVPDSFLGGFAARPSLRGLRLGGIPFPGLPNLLLSAPHLYQLRLEDIPHSGYFSPDAMAAALSTLTSLESLSLTFQSPESCPDLENQHLPPSTHFVLPVLTDFLFKGVSEYLEDLVTDMDTPKLKKLVITFFNDIVFNTPRLIQFIRRTPMLSGLENAHIALRDDTARVTFRSQIYGYVSMLLEVSIFCEGLDWQLSSLEQVCTSYLPFLSTLKDLYIYEYPYSQPYWRDNIENRVWLGLLHPFTTVKNLYISEKFALRIGPALQELVEGRATEVLPALENIFLEGLESVRPVQEGIGHFVATRQVSSHPVTVSRWANLEMDKYY